MTLNANTQPEVHLGRLVTLRELGLGEHWLQDWLVTDPSRLGLGTLKVVDQEQMQSGPAFERMQEMMQQAREAADPAERRQLMREHIEMMGEQMQAMRGMMGDMPMQGQMGGGRMSSGQSMGMSGDQSGQMQEMMGAATPEMMTRMREHLGMMQQMMEQMLEQQKMMMEMNEQQ